MFDTEDINNLINLISSDDTNNNVNNNVVEIANAIEKAKKEGGALVGVGYNCARDNAFKLLEKEPNIQLQVFGLSHEQFQLSDKFISKEIILEYNDEIDKGEREGEKIFFPRGFKDLMPEFENFFTQKSKEKSWFNRTREELPIERGFVANEYETLIALELFYKRYKYDGDKKVMIRNNQGTSGLGNLIIDFSRYEEKWEDLFNNLKQYRKRKIGKYDGEYDQEFQELLTKFFEAIGPLFIERVPPGHDDPKEEAQTGIESFFEDLYFYGADVEEFIDQKEGEIKSSPSVQLCLTEKGPVVMSAHIQIMAEGEYLGAYLLPHPDKKLIETAIEFGKMAHKRGMRGRMGIDFLVKKNGEQGVSSVYFIEQNARETGSMHFTGYTEMYTGAHYDKDTGYMMDAEGNYVTYIGDDNVVSDKLKGMSDEDVKKFFNKHGLMYSENRRLGCVLFNLGNAKEAGKIGVVCIAKGTSKDDVTKTVQRLYGTVLNTVDDKLASLKTSQVS